MLEDKDIDGSIYIKAEWHGFGESMPPARAETLFQQQGAKASRRKPTIEQSEDLLSGKRSIDVNDPRNERVMQNLQQAGNNYHERLLAQDAQFQLAEVHASFRQELLLARKDDPSYANIPIPYLTDELVDADISAFYVDWLEDVQRKRIYKKTIAAVSMDGKLSDKGSKKSQDAMVQDILSDQCKARR